MAEWQQITSPKPKHKGCIFIRLANQRDSFICKVYNRKEAQANADLITVAPTTKLQHDALLAACKEANTEIIAALKIPFDKRLAKDKDNLIYVIRDMRAREDRAQQKLKQAIAESEE